MGIFRELFSSQIWWITLWKCLFLHYLLGPTSYHVNWAPLK